MKIELTIIIPVYNVEKYIEKCIQSVINQTYDGGIECIIVNDCRVYFDMQYWFYLSTKRKRISKPKDLYNQKKQ